MTPTVPPGTALDLTTSVGTLHEIPTDGPLDCREVEIETPEGAAFTVSWQVPLGGAVGFWTSRTRVPKSLGADWDLPVTASVTAEAPAGLLFDARSRCTHALAVSETVTEVAFTLAVSEELNRIHAQVTCTAGAEPARLRLYPAGAGYEDVLSDISAWWSARDPLGGPGSLPRELPPAATEPVYSTWYNMHQQLEQDRLDAELELAVGLGIGSVIIDDGWQTEDNERGYAFTGDWQVTPSRFPDLRAHVDRTHDLGMTELVWIALPFVGRESAAARDVEHLLLPDEERRSARLWDVRLPAARAHVAEICRRLVVDHHLDGLKIDFIDEWSSAPVTPPPAAADTESFAVGVDRLLAAIADELCAAADHPLIEFRQRYVGPRLQRYGNLFRVADCPADGFQNRVSSVDMRHLIKSRAVQSDMVMWSATDPPEDAASQLLCTAFSVPQISMILSELPDDHLAMLRHYLSWWRANKDVLMGGRLVAPRPDLGYPVITALAGEGSVTVGYATEVVIAVPRGRAVIANATGDSSVVVDLASPSRIGAVTDCFGASSGNAAVLPAGLHRLAMPRGGSCVIEGG